MLQLLGRDFCTYPEYTELIKGLKRDGPTSGVLQAFFFGEDVDPRDLHETLDIEARLNATTPAATAAIEQLLTRLEDRYPETIP